MSGSGESYLCVYESQKYLCGGKDDERIQCKGYFVNGNPMDCYYYCPRADNTCQCPSAQFESFPWKIEKAN